MKQKKTGCIRTISGGLRNVALFSPKCDDLRIIRTINIGRKSPLLPQHRAKEIIYVLYLLLLYVYLVYSRLKSDAGFLIILSFRRMYYLFTRSDGRTRVCGENGAHVSYTVKKSVIRSCTYTISAHLP